MDEKSKKDIDTFYSELLHKHGDSTAALAYKNSDNQEKRFALMADLGPVLKQGSVLDIGCGLGHFCQYLRKFGWEGSYTGVDISQDIITAAKRRLPEDNFICTDILTEEFNKQYDYVFCGATIQHRPKYSNPEEYLKQMVRKMFSLTKVALAFDIFSARVDYMDKEKLYMEPASLLNFCYTLSGRVVLRNDARPYEIMIYLYKEASKGEFNIYSGWKPQPPRIV